MMIIPQLFETHFYFIIKPSELHNRKYALFHCSLFQNFYVEWRIKFNSTTICDQEVLLRAAPVYINVLHQSHHILQENLNYLQYTN